MSFDRELLEGNIKQESTFLRVIRINEGIKRISDLSFSIRLRAINTLIFAHKHQESRSGIPVISGEMIKFSIQLEVHAQTITRVAYEMLSHITWFTKRDRLQRYFERISSLLRQAENRESGDRVMGRIRQEYQGVRARTFASTADGMKNLFAGINVLLRFCMTGRVLGTMTRIESARSGRDRAYFMKLADDFRQAIRETEEILRILAEIDRGKD
jgi:hypothetical protein